MFQDSKNPFAAASNNGSSSPFQPAPANGAAAVSPFGAAAPAQPSIPTAKQAVESAPSSPFAIGEGKTEGGSTAPSAPFEPGLVEPTEGFTAEEKPTRLVATVAAVATPAPVAMPDARPVSNVSHANGSADRNDPFAAPTPAAPVAAGRGDFVLPADSTQAAPTQGAAAPVQAAPVKASPAKATAVQATPAVAAAVTGETSQLVLRAIFGVTRELDREEILQRARTLPGIRNLQMVGATEGAAMSTLRDSIQRMGFGDKTTLTLTTSGGVVDIIEEPGTTLAVLHEGTYAAGVRETLIIVARELSSLA